MRTLYKTNRWWWSVTAFLATTRCLRQTGVDRQGSRMLRSLAWFFAYEFLGEELPPLRNWKRNLALGRLVNLNQKYDATFGAKLKTRFGQEVGSQEVKNFDRNLAFCLVFATLTPCGRPNRARTSNENNYKEIFMIFWEFLLYHLVRGIKNGLWAVTDFELSGTYFWPVVWHD